MPKSLGQIHTVSNMYPHATFPLLADNEILIDLPGELTKQLQHMCRMMSTYKVVGIDLAYGPVVNESELSCSMAGEIRYYAPTKGRVLALQHAFKSVMKMMKMSGVNPKDNINYDFRPMIANPANFENGGVIYNQACIEDNSLATCLANGPGSANIFGIYNQGIGPRIAAAADPGFEEGFDIGLRSQAVGADWTLNDGAILTSTVPTASEQLEAIPFNIGYTAADSPAGLANSDDLNWRPDPALYLAVLTGQLIIHIDESAAVNGAGEPDFDGSQLEVAVHVAGWKSILGSDKKRRTKRGKKHNGRSRRHSNKR